MGGGGAGVAGVAGGAGVAGVAGSAVAVGWSARVAVRFYALVPTK